ncbi:MAG: hypothetical protein M3P51_01805 [Chloroflexota bacterium]|nr:hypothetical protein [Chloroflexota bacterium]
MATYDVEYRLATDLDCRELADMRWDFRTEDGSFQEDIRERFVSDCSLFFERGFRDGTWTCW